MSKIWIYKIPTVNTFACGSRCDKKVSKMLHSFAAKVFPTRSFFFTGHEGMMHEALSMDFKKCLNINSDDDSQSNDATGDNEGSTTTEGHGKKV